MTKETLSAPHHSQHKGAPTIALETSLQEAVHLLGVGKYSSLQVYAEEQLVGILTSDTIVSALAGGLNLTASLSELPPESLLPASAISVPEPEEPAIEGDFQRLFDSLQDMLFVLDLKGRIHFCNQAVRDKTGFEREVLFGMDHACLHDPDNRAEARRMFTRMINGSQEIAELPLLTDQSLSVPVEIRSRLGRWHKQPALFLIMRDLSKQIALESQFAAVFLNSPVAMALTDMESGCFREVNRAFEQATGYSADEVVGHSSQELQLFVDYPQRQQMVAELLQSGSIENIRVDIRCRDNSIRKGLFNACLLTLNGHQTLLTLMLDQTERIAVEAELESGRQFLRTLLDTLPDLIWLKDPDGNYLSCNHLFEMVAGYPEAELIGKSDYHLFSRDEAEFFRANDRKTIAADRPRMNEEVLRYSDGSHEALYEVIKTPMRDRSQQLLGVLGVARNISARRYAEDELLAERDLFAGGPVGVLIWEPADGWRVRYASSNIHNLFGYSAEQMCAPTFNYSDCIHPDDAARIGQEVEHFFAAGRERWEQRYRVIRADGSCFWLYDYTVAERDEQGQVKVLRGYVMDESSRVESEARLRLSASVFENAHEGIMITDADQRILDVNPTFCEISGYRRDEVLGQLPSLLKSGRQDAGFYRDLWRTLQLQGYWRGEISNCRKSGEVYIALMTISSIKDESGNLTHYVAVFSDITQMKSHQEKLELLAHYDALTRLPNRVLLADRMDQALLRADRDDHYTAVCYLDLDGFKPVNDLYGHDMGDLLLVEVARRLTDSLRGQDTVARLGGDEFVLLLTGLESVAECEVTAGSVLMALSAPISVGGQELQISASMGITLHPDDGADADRLLRHADQAMYQAKLAGRNRYQFYDPDRDKRALHRHSTIERITQALADEEFELFYQPQVDLVQQRVQGFEALIRWQHPERGMLPPNEFLPAVAGQQVEIEIDHWVLQQAFQLLQRWHRQEVNLRLSINLTGSTLLADDFIARLHRYMNTYPEVFPGLLEFEVLETSALEDMHHAGRVFEICQSLGFRIALDDFGTGYSSLTYFRRLPAETLKIDQSFVRDMLDDPEDLAIVESVIGLAQAFNRELVAEGVESAAHGRLLVQLGCSIVQGYGIARPMPEAEVLAWVQHWSLPDDWHISGTQLPPERRALLVAEMEHRRWLDELLKALSGRPSGLARRVGDHNSCRFGRWYYGLGRVHYGTLPAYKEIEQVHSALHTRAQQLMDDRLILAEAEKSAAIAELTEISTSMQMRLDTLKNQIDQAPAN